VLGLVQDRACCHCASMLPLDLQLDQRPSGSSQGLACHGRYLSLPPCPLACPAGFQDTHGPPGPFC
jgi:hypothetical protein